ncbi:hypothetical protein, partial [Longimicrobium sp.]|uniref:hypothetical protein n=1 Tax=Longimicrobium sp. TaxID=2029185 RepID=UPI002E303F83
MKSPRFLLRRRGGSAAPRWTCRKAARARGRAVVARAPSRARDGAGRGRGGASQQHPVFVVVPQGVRRGPV